MKQLGYFAFGSNLLRKQMEERIAPEQMIEEGRARLSDYRIAFNKERKNDGTRKANIVQDPKRSVCTVSLKLPSLKWTGGREFLEGMTSGR